MGKEPKAFVDPNKRYKGWTLREKLDEGGFGIVYKVTKDSQVAAFKAESNSVEGGSAIKLELNILMILNKKFPDTPHFPYLYHAAKRKQFSYMIVTLLGKNIRNLKSWKKGSKTLKPETWARIGLQALYCIKLVHDAGFLHRDIKPANFMMGRDDDPERARLVHILDFGLARGYIKHVGDKIVARRARAHAEFRGTVRYCSPNVHFSLEQSRRDDLWSLLYMMIELHCGLPWQTVSDKGMIEKMKMISDDSLVSPLPEEIRPMVKHLRKLDVYSRPDYNLVANMFKKLCKRLNVNFATPYDWEYDNPTTFNLGEKLYKLNDRNIMYENSEAFFCADPIKISGPPPKGFSDERLPTDEERTIYNPPSVEGKVSDEQEKSQYTTTTATGTSATSPGK
ncbi:unnamed protein product [Bursaphelenchus okinawaensis]|uniref:non-specific serine/threonine protein kinase n=1 Tax=Bursaphelenchus okinawaensis TaxID=465554 RepID=A0A811K047_9BILA|nr:unnamed protein product [Bursaphelenchus okinawaensis]CAG9088654.1 unnamed protein product [Bursaphelenchus okinawaensis]